MQLYLAARAGWLVWRSADDFALLEPPLRYHPAGRSGIAVWLPTINRWWAVLSLMVFWLIGLLAALVFALIPATRLAAELLVLLIFLAVGLEMTVVVLRGFWWLARILEPSQWKRDRTVADPYFAGSWSVLLWHIGDPRHAQGIVATLSEHVEKLNQRTASPVDAAAGNPLLVRERGITTSDARAAIRGIAAAVSLGSKDSQILLIGGSGGRGRFPIPDLRPPGGVLLFSLAIAVILFLDASFVADAERTACATRTCATRPATYSRALYWAFDQLFFTNPPGMVPASMQARVVGPEIRLFSVVLFGLIGVTLFRYRTWYKKEVRKLGDAARTALGKTTTLILVANQTERDAVISSFQKATDGRPVHRQFLGQHTFFDLGVLSATRVLLAQSEQGIESPRAMTLTADYLITRCQPDYVILAGICFGLWEEENLGDVVVSTQLRNLNWKKVVETVPGMPDEFIRSDRVQPGVLLDRCRAAEMDWTEPKVHFGVILSENVLVDSAGYRRYLKEIEPDAAGGEMEGAGVYAAAAKNRVEWIIIKGISDWGQNKTSEFRAMAAESAAEFVAHVIKTGALDLVPTGPTATAVFE